MHPEQLQLQGEGQKHSIAQKGKGYAFQLGKVERIEVPAVIFVQQCFC